MAAVAADEKVKKIIVEQLGVEAEEVTPQAKFIEEGPGKVLAGLVKRIAEGAAINTVEDPDGVRAVREALG